MIALLAAGLAALGALAVVLARGWPRGACLAGVVALSAVTAAVVVAPLEAPVALGEAYLVDAPLTRLWLSGMAGSLALVVLVALLVGPSSTFPMVACVLVAATGLSLALSDPTVALILAAGGGLLSLAGAGRAWEGPYRQAAVVAGLAVGAVLLASLIAPTSPALVLPAILVVGAVGLRVGAVPLQVAPLRAARTAPLTMVPLLSVWAPYLFGLLAVAWATAGPVAGVLDTPAVRDALAIVGGLTVVLAALAMLVQDDLGALLGVHAIGDGALVLLALAGGAAALPALVAWLIVSGLARTALAAWSVAVASRMGSRRIDETRGWIRRAPLLLPALVVPVVAGVGWPGSPPFEARRLIAEGVMPEAVALLVTGASIALAMGYLRLAWSGIQRADDASDLPAHRARRAAGWSAAALVLVMGALVLVVVVGYTAEGFTEASAAAAGWRPFQAR